MSAKDWSTEDKMKLSAEYGLQNMGPGITEKKGKLVKNPHKVKKGHLL